MTRLGVKTLLEKLRRFEADMNLGVRVTVFVEGELTSVDGKSIDKF